MEIRKIRIKAQGSLRNAPVFPVYFSLKIPGSDPDKPDILFNPHDWQLGTEDAGNGCQCGEEQNRTREDVILKLKQVTRVK